jgi:nitroimidazol reductase NimA-like FMN-containing flavoprotein (pyridoxamine 5'-phosphate oxidase superfamily)
MAYVCDEGCRELHMVTHRHTKKYSNLRQNPQVSVLIDTREEDRGNRLAVARALTISGLCQEVEGEEKKERVRASLQAKHPQLADFLNEPDAVLLCLRPQSFLLLEGLSKATFEKLP